MTCTCWRVNADNDSDCGWCGTGRYSLDAQVEAIVADVAWFLDVFEMAEGGQR